MGRKHGIQSVLSPMCAGATLHFGHQICKWHAWHHPLGFFLLRCARLWRHRRAAVYGSYQSCPLFPKKSESLPPHTPHTTPHPHTRTS